MATVQQWSGVEVRALREAKRMSIREFAAHLGISERMVSKWEAGREAIHPRPISQAALDTCLSRSDPDSRARFTFVTGYSGIRADADVLGREEPANKRAVGEGSARYSRNDLPVG